MEQIQGQTKWLNSTSYSFVFDFEKNFNGKAAASWFYSHATIAHVSVATYLVVVFFGKILMKSREAYELKTPFLLWNLMLSTFSIIGLSRTLPELSLVLKEYGFTYSICNPSHIYAEVSSLWCFAFAASKIPELIDTVFIILRKKPLIFLHWYHHATVLLYSWYGMAMAIGPGRWFIVINYFVHSMMYTYYTLRTAGVRVPKFVSMTITTAQILQMIAGSYITCHAYLLTKTETPCRFPDKLAKYGLLMYLSYLLLFVNFFYNSYIASSRKKLKTK